MQHSLPLSVVPIAIGRTPVDIEFFLRIQGFEIHPALFYFGTAPPDNTHGFFKKRGGLNMFDVPFLQGKGHIDFSV